MKNFIKYGLLSIAFLSILSILSIFNIKNAKAESVTCPAGYTCKPISVVPNCPSGYFCTKTTTDNDMYVSNPSPSISPSSESSITVNSNKLSLSYDNQSNEGNLVAKISVTVNGGKNGIYLYQYAGGVSFFDQNNRQYNVNNQTQTLSPVSKVNIKTDNYGQSLYFVEPGTSRDFVVTSSIPANNLFAGTYKAKLYSMYVNSNLILTNSRNFVVASNSSNAITIMGEKGPYIKSITGSIKPGGKIAIIGERFSARSRSEVVTIYLDGVSSGLAFSTTADGKEIQLTLPNNILKGGHIFEVNNSVTGRSNRFSLGFESDSVDSSTDNIEAISAYLADANSDKAGIWDNFGPGIGNVNKTKKDWHWVVSLKNNNNNNNTRKIKSITVTHAGYEGWSTASANVFGTKPYPLVVLGNQSTSVPINSITKYVDDNSGITPSFSNTNLSFDLYGQIESSSWRGGVILVKFTDGTELSANIPASSVKPAECPAGYTCTDYGTTKPLPPVYTTPSPSASATNQPLNVYIKSPTNNSVVNVGTSAFTATASGGSGSYKYMWNFGDNTAVSDGRLINGSSEKIYHNFTKEGTYRVNLYVIDAKTSAISNTNTITVKVVAANQELQKSVVSTTLPTANIVSPLNKAKFLTGFLASFSGSASNGSGKYTYYWNFGDGSSELIETRDGNVQGVTHMYNNTGRYTVKLYVKDAAGLVSEIKSIEVDVFGATITKPYPSSVKRGELVTIRGYGLANIDENRVSIRDGKGGDISPLKEGFSSTESSIIFKMPIVPAGQYKISVLGDGGESNEEDISVVDGTNGASIFNWFSSVFGK
jgi:PKD repeat protein